MVKEVSGHELDELVSSGKTVVCDFWASWCGPCRMLGPVVEKLSEEFGERAQFVKVNVDDNGDLAASLGIFSIPDVFIFADGAVKRLLRGKSLKAERKKAAPFRMRKGGGFRFPLFCAVDEFQEPVDLFDLHRIHQVELVDDPLVLDGIAKILFEKLGERDMKIFAEVEEPLERRKAFPVFDLVDVLRALPECEAQLSARDIVRKPYRGIAFLDKSLIHITIL